MSTNPPGYAHAYYAAIRADLIQKFGGECQARNCHNTDVLEFAHKTPNEINGRGRGRQQRYQSIRKNPENYLLLCHDHHVKYDNELDIGVKGL